MNVLNRGIGRKAAVVGSLALVGGIGQLGGAGRADAAVINLSGVANFQETNATTSGQVSTTNTTPGTQSFPYLLSREHSSNSGAYEILPFIKINTSSVTLGPGEFVSGAELGIYFTDSTYWGGSAARSNYVDLWAVSDNFVPASVNMTTYDGTNPWSDGFQAGINGFLRSGPPNSHLAQLWNVGQAPAGTPSNQTNDNVQEYKLFMGGALDEYLTQQILAGQDAYLALTNNGDNANGLRFVASSDVSWGSFLDNRPYLTIRTDVPEPATGVVLLSLGAAVVGRRRRRIRSTTPMTQT